MTAKSISIKGTGCKSGGGVRKAVELTSGDLSLVRDTGLRIGQPVLTGRQKSAEGVLVRQRMKARTVIVGSSARLLWTAMRQPIRFGGACQGRTFGAHEKLPTCARLD